MLGHMKMARDNQDMRCGDALAAQVREGNGASKNRYMDGLGLERPNNNPLMICFVFGCLFFFGRFQIGKPSLKHANFLSQALKQGHLHIILLATDQIHFLQYRLDTGAQFLLNFIARTLNRIGQLLTQAANELVKFFGIK